MNDIYMFIDEFYWSGDTYVLPAPLKWDEKQAMLRTVPFLVLMLIIAIPLLSLYIPLARRELIYATEATKKNRVIKTTEVNNHGI